MLNNLANEIYNNNVDKGFYDQPMPIASRLALIHSEVSEALEADRKELHSLVDIKELVKYENDDAFVKHFLSTVKDTFEDELADALIRVLDLAASGGIDIESHVLAKIRYNKTPPYKHGKKY